MMLYAFQGEEVLYNELLNHRRVTMGWLEFNQYGKCTTKLLAQEQRCKLNVKPLMEA